MSTTIPKTEPTQIRAGDTWQWRREDLSVNYPAPTWTLTYAFKNSAKGFSFDAVADGAFFAVTVPAAETGDYPAGKYGWAAQVSSGALHHTISMGTMEVLANVFADPDAAGDTRSRARRTLDAVEAVLENRASLDQQEYEINGRRLIRMKLSELIALRDYWKAEVAREDVAPGTSRRKTAYVRFGIV